jgi:FkbH-like protein
MKIFIYRNSTIEQFFRWNKETSYSGYDEIDSSTKNAKTIIWFYLLSYRDDNKRLSDEIYSYKERLQLFLLTHDYSKELILMTISPVGVINYESDDWSVKEACHTYNSYLYDITKDNSSIKVVDMDNFFQNYGEKEIIDWRYYYLSSTHFSPLLSKEFEHWFKNQIRRINLIRKKCIILDLDNTLWGGILGEDGINGIKLGESYPGNTYLDFQKNLLELNKKGILLAVVSKNNRKDVIDYWDKSDVMILKENNFVSLKINWNDKANNIIEIANELNLGLESLVFIDDNPHERELIKIAFDNKIATPDFPDKPYNLRIFFKLIVDNYFGVYKTTKEDQVKQTQYVDNSKRKKSEKAFNNMNDFIKSLELELKIIVATDDNLARFSQLTQKTNQFNLTTKRYTESEIKNMISDNHLIHGLSVRDKFGDYGIVGLIIIKIDTTTSSIDSFMLSCRILGKGIEHAFLKRVFVTLVEMGINKVSSEYIKSEKNFQVQDFYKTNNMIEQHVTKNKTTYSIELDKLNMDISDNYKFI